MNTLFEKPMFEIVNFDDADIITSSCDDHFCWECKNCDSEHSDN